MILEQPFIKQFILTGTDGYEQGWHERNGGNLSYRIKPEEIEPIKNELDRTQPFWPIGVTVKNLAGEYFLVTGSGKFFRHLSDQPCESAGIIEIDETGSNYRIVFGFENGGKPTSELPSHLMNHSVKVAKDKEYRVIYHAHTTNLIALTFVLPLKDEIFTRELWEMATECPVVFPEGVGVIDWMVPGSIEIAQATSEKMKHYDLAIWAHHGTFAAGKDLDTTFGLMHTAEKAAEILVKVLSMSPTKAQTILPNQFCMVANAFNVELDEKFLYEK